MEARYVHDNAAGSGGQILFRRSIDGGNALSQPVAVSNIAMVGIDGSFGRTLSRSHLSWNDGSRNQIPDTEGFTGTYNFGDAV